MHRPVWRRQDFAYDLPPDRIAQYPLAERRDSRLLVLDGATGALFDRQFGDMVTLLRPGDLLVLNDTRVVPARLFGHKDTGGRVEVLLERVLDDHHALVHLKASKTPRPGMTVHMDAGFSAVVDARRNDLFTLRLAHVPAGASWWTLLEAHGQVPLPPYMQRAPAPDDRMRYQTVYARHRGAVAAPTAGLHFDAALLATLQAMGVQQAFITLHVGAGTFQPVRVDDLSTHTMHSEWLTVSAEVCAHVQATRAQGGRVVAVGTTTVRALETAAQSGALQPWSGETQMFIMPGYRFQCVDALITNFHLPESTLLMLVAAFGGYDNVLRAYQHAVEQGYRFFSYGDAMFLTRCLPA